jgi:hypothetical protein
MSESAVRLFSIITIFCTGTMEGNMSIFLKRVWIVILVVAMTFVFCACSGGDVDKRDRDDDDRTETHGIRTTRKSGGTTRRRSPRRRRKKTRKKLTPAPMLFLKRFSITPTGLPPMYPGELTARVNSSSREADRSQRPQARNCHGHNSRRLFIRYLFGGKARTVRSNRPILTNGLAG